MHRRTRSLLSTALAAVTALSLIGVAAPAAGAPAESVVGAAETHRVEASIPVPRVENVPAD